MANSQATLESEVMFFPNAIAARAVRLAPTAGAMIIQYGELYRRLASLSMRDGRSDGPRPDHNLHRTDRLRLAVGNP